MLAIAQQEERKTFSEKELKLMGNIDLLFDIYFDDTKQCSKIEKSHGLKMIEKDFDFYLDQKTERKQKCLNIVEALQPSDIKF